MPKSLCCGETHPAQKKTGLVGEALAPLRTTVSDDLAAAAGLHTSTETALARAANFGRTIGRLHICLDLIVKLERTENQFSTCVASGNFSRRLHVQKCRREHSVGSLGFVMFSFCRTFFGRAREFLRRVRGFGFGPLFFSGRLRELLRAGGRVFSVRH